MGLSGNQTTETNPEPFAHVPSLLRRARHCRNRARHVHRARPLSGVGRIVTTEITGGLVSGLAGPNVAWFRWHVEGPT